MARVRLDPIAASAAVVAGAMLVAYLSIIRRQDGEPAAWVVVALVAGCAAAAYGTVEKAPLRRIVLTAGGLLLLGVGLLAILTIGLALLLAGSLCVAAALRARPISEEERPRGHTPLA